MIANKNPNTHIINISTINYCNLNHHDDCEIMNSMTPIERLTTKVFRTHEPAP